MLVKQYFYDNIVFAPFIFVEDPGYVNGQQGLSTDANSTWTTTPLPAARTASTTFLRMGSKVDPYYLIANVSHIHRDL